MNTEVVAIHTVAVLDASDYRFAGGAAAHLTLNDWHHAALVACDV